VINIPKKKSGTKSKGKKKETKGKKADKKDDKEEPKESTDIPFIPEFLTKNLDNLSADCLMTELLKFSWDEIRAAPQELINNALNPDTISHLLRAGMEVYAVVQDVGPDGKIPEHAKFHMYRAEKEVLLAVKAVMDMRLKKLDEKIDEEGAKCTPGETDLNEKGLKKIKVKD
jgi:hypothetical protein